MKKELVILSLSLSLSLLMLGLVGANSVTFDEKNISGDVFLKNNSVPDDYYSFITFDLNNFFNDNSIDLYSIKSNLSLVVVGGLLVPNMKIGLIQNQTINLSGDSVSLIFNQPVSLETNYFWGSIGSGVRYEIPIDNLIKKAITDGNRYATIKLYDTNATSPNIKDGSGVLTIGSNINILNFGSSTENSVNDYKPKLKVFYDLINNSNISVNPNEFRWLPQLNSTIQLDTSGLERIYLFCTWKIDNKGGNTPFRINGTLCPPERQNFTFLNDEKYFISIDYSNISYNTNTMSWGVLNVNNSINLTQNYKMNLPEPSESLFSSIIDTINVWINSVLCFLFGIC